MNNQSKATKIASQLMRLIKYGSAIFKGLSKYIFACGH